MPGTVFELSLDDAIAIVLAAQHDAQTWSTADVAPLLAEAHRIIECNASAIAARCLAPLARPRLSVI